MVLGCFDKVLQELWVEDLVVVHQEYVFWIVNKSRSDAGVRAFGKPEVAVALDDLDVRKLTSDRLACPIRRPVVDDDNADVEAFALDTSEAPQSL